MFDIETFHTTIFEGIVNDPKAEGGVRDTRFISAGMIPLAILNKMGFSMENKRHPHKVEGMAWDLTVGGWRNMKNAKFSAASEAEVVWDMADSRTFIA